MAEMKILTLERLTEYTELMKAKIDSGDESVKSYVDTEVAKKANSSHDHNDKYYTETEIDSKISGVNTSISSHTGNTGIHVTSTEKSNWNAAKSHADSAHAPSNAQANVIESIKVNGTAQTITSKSVNIAVPTTASEIGAATSDHNHDSKYDAKGAAATALDSAKAYADSAAATVKNDLLNGAGTAYDTLKELGELIVDNKDAIDVLEEVAAGKADAGHTHDDRYYTETEINTKLAGKADSSHGTHVTYDSTNKPKMDGTAAFGTSASVARADHVHPTDTSRASQAALDSLTSVVNGKSDSGHGHNVATTSASGFMSADMVTKLNGIATGANKTTVDSSLSSTSTNPVQNKVVNSAITTATSAISANTNSIATLQAAIEDIQEITKAEIEALFA